MATNTYVALATQTLTQNTSSIEFSSIPQNYTDLVLVMEYAGSIAAEVPAFRLNGDTTGTYSVTHLSANGSTPRSARASNATSAYISYSSAFPQTLMMNSVIHFMNYSNNAKHKAALIRTDSRDGTYNATEINATLWRDNSNIHTITLIGTNGASYYTGSTFTLYGIAAEGPSPKATGGTIYTDAEYYYHVFGNTSAFVPSQSLTADILAVGGGGAGGNDAGAGGGAGGVIYFNGQSLSASSYTVTVGGGGATSNTLSAGISGSNSSFGSLTAAVGGGGGTTSNGVAGNGGSGGGGGRNTYLTGGSTTQTGTGATAYHGNAGGNGGSGGGYPAGGGGAGAVGGNNIGGLSGVGGIGISTYSEIFSRATGVGHLVNGVYYLAGGGGGGANGGNAQGAGGYGGGGQGGLYNNPGTGTAGTANTGGGGGGGAGGYGITTNAAAGGSGVVIVRYLK